MALILAAALQAPTDRSYVMAETDRETAEVAQCAQAYFDKGGKASVATTEFGSRVEFRYANLGGAVDEPSMILDVGDGPKRTVLLYGFGPWRGATKNTWKQMAKKCFPELRDAPLVKP